MPIRAFPDAESASPEGLIAVGGDLHEDSLVLAYRSGIFPWPHDGLLCWFSPPERAVLEYGALHVPRSLRYARRKTTLRCTIDQDFAAVITACGKVHTRREGGTWITKGMLKAYVRMHQLGYAHSVEVWDGEALVGGTYGVCVAGVFAAESMFHLVDNASKLAVLHLMDALHARGLDWIDIQMMTPHMERLGARALPRSEFLTMMRREQARGLTIFEAPVGA